MTGQNAEPDRLSAAVADRVDASAETRSTFSALVPSRFAFHSAAISEAAGGTAGFVQGTASGLDADPPTRPRVADGSRAVPGGAARDIAASDTAGEIQLASAVATISVPSTFIAGQSASGVDARFVAATFATAADGSSQAAAANATPGAVNAAPAATAAHPSVSHAVRLDGNWTSGTVSFLAAAIFSRQLMEAASLQVTARGVNALDARDNRLTKLPV